MPTPITSARLNQLRVQFEARFLQGLGNAAPWHKAITMDVPSGARSNLYALVEDMIEVREWIGEREAQNMSEREYELINRRFEMSRAINRDKLADDTIGLIPHSMEDMGRAAAAFPDRQIARIMTANDVLCYDGLSYFNAAHTKANGDTFSNTAALELTEANLETVLAALMSQTNSNGDVIDVGTKFILAVSPTERSTAFRLVEAEHAVNGGAAIENPNKGLCTPLVVPQLATNPNRWAVFAVGLSIKPVIRQIREAISFTTLDQDVAECVNKRNENEYSATFREAYGVTLPQLGYISDPDGAP